MAYIITMQDIKKFEVLNQLINNQITGYQAADILGIANVHISRLKHKKMPQRHRGHREKILLYA